MKPKIFAIIAILIVLILGWYAYHRWQQARAESAGTPELISGPDENSKVVVDRAELDRLRAEAAAPAPAPAAPAAVPATDSIPANPPNGMRFAGSGRFQLYRQGSITWRVDTETGHACIIFATDEEWALPRVYRHGCNER